MAKAKTHTLRAEDRKRTGTGVLKQMRREGYIPSVIYGGGIENRNVKVRTKDFREMVSHSASSNVIVDLQLDGGNQLAFVRDLQYDPLTGGILHADFLAVQEDTEINAQIPVELLGEPEGVKLGGLLEQLLYTIEISCRPKDLPDTIKTDVSGLAIGDALHVGAIDWPAGVRCALGEDVVVALVAKARVALAEGEEGEALEGQEGAPAAPAAGGEEASESSSD